MSFPLITIRILRNRSSKSTDQDTVGQFGEGYKIAALVLNRLGKTFTIYNNMMNQVWTSKFKNSNYNNFIIP